MRFAAWAVLLLIALAPVPAAAGTALDPIDELLGVSSSTSDVALEPDSGSSPIATRAIELQAIESGSIAVAPAAAPEPVDAHRAKPIQGAPFNPVPEPTALLLAVAALVYFLIFGRRRRLA